MWIQVKVWKDFEKLNFSLMMRKFDVVIQVNTVQKTLVEAWGLIRETFVDPTFNHQGMFLRIKIRNQCQCLNNGLNLVRFLS